MRLQLKQFLGVARLTAREAWRQPACLLITLSCVSFMALLPALIMHVMGDPDKLVRDSALALQFVGGLVLAGYTACAAMKHEIQRGTVATVLTKPVGRGLFFLAKFAGVAGVLVVYAVATSLTTILATRMVRESYTIDWWTGIPLWLGILLAVLLAGAINYLTNRPFVSTAQGWLVALLLVFLGTSLLDSQGNYVGLGSDIQWQLVPAGLLLTLALLVLAGLAVALATVFDTVATLSLCSVIFLVGLMTDYLFGRIADQHWLAALAYGLLPNWQHFWMADALSGEPGVVPWHYVGRAAIYAGSYLVGVLAAGMLVFNRIEVES